MAALNVIAVVAVIALLRFAMELFVTVVLAILLTYALEPAVRWISHLKIPRVASAAIVVLALIGGMGYGAYRLQGQVMLALESLPKATSKIRNQLRPSENTGGTAVGKLQEAAQQVEKALADATSPKAVESTKVQKVRLEEPTFRGADYLWSGSIGLLYLIEQSVLVISLAFFLLASGDLFKRKLVTLIGSRLSAKRDTVDAINEINRQIERFLLVQVLTGAIVAVGSALILWAFGVAQPVVWGIAAGLTSVVPYFGAMAAVGAISLVTFLQFNSVTITLQVMGAMVVFRTLESTLLIPALMGKAAGMNGVAMFVGLLFWGWAWGTIGLIVAVPLMMVCKIACDRIEGLHSIGELLGERSVKT